MYIAGLSVSISNSTFDSGNWAISGGGIYEEVGTVTLGNCAIGGPAGASALGPFTVALGQGGGI